MPRAVGPTADNQMELSLTGSQISTHSLGSRPNSAGRSKRSTSAATAERHSVTVTQNGLSKGKSLSTTKNIPRRGSQGTHSDRSDTSHSSKKQISVGDDYLTFFDVSSITQPKIMKPSTSQKSKKVTQVNKGLVNKAAKPRDLDPSAGGMHIGANKDFSHSIFHPVSARSTSTVDSDVVPVRLGRGDASEDHFFPIDESGGQKVNLHSSLSGSIRDDFFINQNDNKTSSLNASESGSVMRKSLTMNSIANNMTSQALSPRNKTPLHGLENSYQNIKHKLVNQSRQTPQTGNSNVTEDYIKLCNMSATKIQRWYRRHSTRRKVGEAAVRRLLENKKEEKEKELLKEKNVTRLTEDERKRNREEKARLARQQAIQELQRKREEKRQETRHKAEEEVRYLQASGKVGKTPTHKTSNVKKEGGAGVRKRMNSEKEDQKDDTGEKSFLQPAPVSARNVDDFFQNNQKGTRPKGDRSGHNSEASSGNAAETESAEHKESDGAGSGRSRTKTTLEDLMDTLKKLEEEEGFLENKKKDKNQTPQNWLDDLERSDGEKSEILTEDKLQKLEPNKDNIKKSGYLTDEKLKSIISFLDEVETADRLSEIDQDIVKVNEYLEKPALLVPSGEEIAQMEQASAAAAEVTNTVLAQKLELDEKKRTVQMLQKALNQQRELTVRHARETEKEMKKRLDVQKLEYEEAIKRHLAFIDQLIDDKKDLGEKCEKFVKELKIIDKKYSDKIKTMEEKHDIELRKLKEMTAAAEKMRREKWIDEKTKKIKEMTVKGLEPEIQRLIAKHKEEMRKFKAIHEADLLASDERAGQRYIKMTEELRDQLAAEKEAACARERQLAKDTYEKQLQQEEEAYQALRRRLYSEVQEEKDRLSQMASRQRTELDKLQRQLEENHKDAADSLRREYEKGREEQERRHSSEMKLLKDQLAAEKVAWEENYKKRQEAWLAAKERELKEQVRRERDKEIEMVIGRLEEDTQTTREEAEKLAENRIKRIRDKYEAEMTEFERSEKLTTEKYNKTKASLVECEGENERMKVTLKQKDREINELKKHLEKLNEERDHVSDVIRQEFADRIVAIEEENKRVKTEMAEMKARHRIEVERVKADVEVMHKAKDEEMEEVHKRVKQAMVKKEEVVNQLKQQYQAAMKRADHLEGLLEQQRKQLLGAAKKT